MKKENAKWIVYNRLGKKYPNKSVKEKWVITSILLKGR